MTITAQKYAEIVAFVHGRYASYHNPDLSCTSTQQREVDRLVRLQELLDTDLFTKVKDYRADLKTMRQDYLLTAHDRYLLLNLETDAILGEEPKGIYTTSYTVCPTAWNGGASSGRIIASSRFQQLSYAAHVIFASTAEDVLSVDFTAFEPTVLAMCMGQDSVLLPNCPADQFYPRLASMSPPELGVARTKRAFISWLYGMSAPNLTKMFGVDGLKDLFYNLFKDVYYFRRDLAGRQMRDGYLILKSGRKIAATPDFFARNALHELVQAEASDLFSNALLNVNYEGAGYKIKPISLRFDEMIVKIQKPEAAAGSAELLRAFTQTDVSGMLKAKVTTI